MINAIKMGLAVFILFALVYVVETRAAGSGGALWKLNSIGPSRRLIFFFAKLYQSAETPSSRCI
jgi:hypothetical protein